MRAGFAYTITEGNRPLVVRGGYGIYGYPMPLRDFNARMRTGYVGTHGSRLDRHYPYNCSPNDYVWFTMQGVARPAGTFAGTSTRGFENTTFGNIEEYRKTGWSNSQNFQVEIQRRYAKGSGFQMFYVLSNTLKAGGSGWEDAVLTPLVEV